MSNLPKIRQCFALLRSGGKSHAVVCVTLFGIALWLFPSTCFCQDGLYFQINSGTVGFMGREIGFGYWSPGPRVGAEVGCDLGGFLSPSVSMSYTLLTLNWDEVDASDAWIRDAVGSRSFILTGSFNLRLSDLDRPGILKHYILVGGTFLTQKTARVKFSIWDSPFGIQCQGETSDRIYETESMFLIDIGSGFGIGEKGGAVVLVQGKVSISPSREIAYFPLEVGLRF